MRDLPVVDVTPRLKPDIRFCGCGCGAKGRPGRRVSASFWSPEQIHVKGCIGSCCTTMLRRAPLKRSSRRPRRTPAQQAVYDDAKLIVLARSGGKCEMRFSTFCTGRGSHTHHIRQQRYGICDDPDWLLWACGPCNVRAETHPDEAIAAGLIDPDWRRGGR